MRASFRLFDAGKPPGLGDLCKSIENLTPIEGFGGRFQEGYSDTSIVGPRWLSCASGTLSSSLT